MLARMGNRELEMAELRSSNDILDDTEALRDRLEGDGYLLIRGLHDRELVMKARGNVLERLQSMGRLAEGVPVSEGRIGPDNKSAFFGSAASVLKETMPEFVELVEHPRVLAFFGRLLGGKAMTYDYKWPRAVAGGDFTGSHYDIVYMGRGTKKLYTMWTPLGDVPIESGPLAVLLGSQRFEPIKRTYGEMDVDRDNIEKGWFTSDPLEITEKYGGQWATTPFQAGDAIIFGMFLMHASLNNETDRYRLSSDTRYQLASEPVDDRWIGEKPKAHYNWGKEPMVPMEEARKKWGV